MKRFLSLALVLLMLVGLAACATTGNTVSETSSAAGTSSAESEVSEEEKFVLFSNLPEINYEGETVRFLVEGDYMDTYKSVEVMPHESSYETLNGSILDRNNLVEERFGVKIEEYRTSSSTEMSNTLTENATAGISEYDVVMPYVPAAAKAAQQGYFVDLASLKGLINKEMPYYDQGCVQGLSIGGKNYFLTGDMTLLASDVTHVLLFNKDVVIDHNLESPYDLVNSGKWTIDKMAEMAKEVTANVDGKTEWTHMDKYGFLVNHNFISSMFIGSGLRFTDKDHNDEPIITVYSENATKVFNKIFDLVNDPNACGQIDNNARGFGSTAVADGKTVWVAATEAIASQRCLFRAVALNSILALGEYDCNFGVLPTPKFDEAQENYYCRVSTIYASCVAIPVNAKDIEKSAIVIDAMMQASTDTVTEAYIEVIMKERKIQDDESEAMMDLIFDSRTYDFGTVFNWGGTGEADSNSITGFMNNIAWSGTNTFVSSWETIASGVEKAMNETTEIFKNLD